MDFLNDGEVIAFLASIFPQILLYLTFFVTLIFLYKVLNLGKENKKWWWFRLALLLWLILGVLDHPDLFAIF